MGSEEVGNIYTGSVYMSLMSLLEKKGPDLMNKNIGIFSYGSGCGAEFLIAHVGKQLKQQAKHLNFTKQLKSRKKISVKEYAELYGPEGVSDTIRQKDIIGADNEFARYFFTGVKDHKRQYMTRESARFDFAKEKCLDTV
jgi:hydroxymethylglutaryl-CoA synthase